MGYKLEVHQKNFLKFIYGSSTSIEVLGQNEETEIGTSGIVQEEKVETKKPQDVICDTPPSFEMGTRKIDKQLNYSH